MPPTRLGVPERGDPAVLLKPHTQHCAGLAQGRCQFLNYLPTVVETAIPQLLHIQASARGAAIWNTLACCANIQASVERAVDVREGGSKDHVLLNALVLVIYVFIYV